METLSHNEIRGLQALIELAITYAYEEGKSAAKGDLKRAGEYQGKVRDAQFEIEGLLIKIREDQ